MRLLLFLQFPHSSAHTARITLENVTIIKYYLFNYYYKAEPTVSIHIAIHRRYSPTLAVRGY